MKKILLVVLSVMLMPCGLQAQDTETHVTVHADETALETLLTEEQKQSVTHLTVTGTLWDEDYAFLRGGLLEQLDTLDLREAEIDTIPAGALGEMNLYLILPEVIKCIGDYSPRHKPLMLASKDHPWLVNVEELCYFAVYSQNGDTLYYLKPNEFVYEREDVEIRPGTWVIAPTAIRDMDIPIENTNLVLPESMDSIGDYALDIRPNFITGYSKKNRYPNGGESYGDGSIVCEAQNPPKFGRPGKSFWVSHSYVYVPEASLEAYKTAPGWKLARKIDTIENLMKKWQSIPSARGEGGTSVSITSTDETYILNFSKAPLQMDYFSTDGSLISSQKLSSMEVTLPKTKLKKALTIVCVRFADGMNETFKLIP